MKLVRCMKEEMPRTSESQMISAVVSWMKDNCPEKQFLYTDGIMGKPGFVYAANFLYGGFIWTQIYISDKGEKQTSRRLCDENVQFKLEREPVSLKERYMKEYIG